MRERMLAMWAGVLLVAGAAWAGEANKVVTTEKVAVTPDAELLKKIEALPDNTWLKLPTPKVVGDMGVLNKSQDYLRTGPRVRDYCNKMVWAPERSRALYCGGGHNVHPYNDVWEYDLAANTWICLYGADPVPPRGPRKGEQKDNTDWYKRHAKLKDGVVTTLRGAPLRPCHTWWGLTYDTEKKRMLFLESHKGLFSVDKAALARALGLDPKDPILRGSGSGAGEGWLFSFDPETRTWTNIHPPVPKAYESSQLEYLPDRKSLWWHSGKTCLFNESKNEWAVAVPKGGIRSGALTAYDPESGKIVATAGKKTMVYDCASNAWTVAQAEAPDGGFVPRSLFCYDSVAKLFLLYTSLKFKEGPAGIRFWTYDLKANEWTKVEAQGDVPTVGGGASYYDPARNVMVLYHRGGTWVYRCKRAP